VQGFEADLAHDQLNHTELESRYDAAVGAYVTPATLVHTIARWLSVCAA
jgi:hypothetical protein